MSQDVGSDRFIRERECKAITGLSRATRWRMERDGKFPKRRQISKNGVAWLLSELTAWMQTRMEVGMEVGTEAA